MRLDTPISELNRAGKTMVSRLKKIGLNTIEDLVFHFPFRYEDYSQIKTIEELEPDAPVSVKVKIQLIANRRSFRKRMTVTEALVGDETGSLKVVWFNQPYISKTLKVGDDIFLSGRVDESRFQMMSPEYEKINSKNMVNTARLIPIYHLTSGITQKQIRFLISQIKHIFSKVEEYIPSDILKKYGYPNLGQALSDIHFPNDQKRAEIAKNRLKFDELFLVQLAIQLSREDLNNNKALKVSFIEKATKDFVDSLPFELTADQKKCSWEIIQDLGKNKIMNRLLEGDVGSGKTVVVALAILNVILNGYKVVLMAPTEILAIQHAHTFSEIFKKQRFDIALLTGSKKELNGEKFSKKKLLEKLESGEVDLIVGTHAVIQDYVKIKDLALVIVDEQHRFGVNQRKNLVFRDKKQLIPHFLSMTATPIPRSLVLALYGDLDLSLIKQMPAGRKPIVTKVVNEMDRYKAYDFMQKQIADGRQVFVICPLIDPSDKLGVKSVKQEFEKLDREVFPDLNIGLMHGRLKSKEKESVMDDFLNKKLDILVSTSVIEVGIDVPNASIMMIEGADRFGLAQLHQFRGRVGRGEHQSYCFIFSENNAVQTQERLKYLETCSDGFSLAEKDLKLRGPGEVYGVKQSGMPELKVAKLTDVEIIKQAQLEAKEIIKSKKINPQLEDKVNKLKISMHFE